MKIKILLLTLGFNLFVVYSFSQKVFNIQADYIFLKQSKVYYIEKWKNELVVKVLQLNNPRAKYNINVDTLEKWQDLNRIYEVEDKDIIPVNSLKNISPTNLLKELQNKEFQQEQVGTPMSLLKILDENLFATLYWNSNHADKMVMKPGTKLYDLSCSSTMDGIQHPCIVYFVVNINKKYPVVILLKSNYISVSWGYIISLPGKYKAEYRGEWYARECIYGIDEVTQRIAEHREFSIRTYFYVFSKNNKYGLRCITDNTIISPKYDDIRLHGSDLIYARKGNEIVLFDMFARKIPYKGIRAYHDCYDNGSTQVLMGNKLYWISNTGKRTNLPPRRTYNTSYYKKEIDSTVSYTIHNKDQAFFIVDNNKNMENTAYKIGNENEYDKVMFINGSDKSDGTNKLKSSSYKYEETYKFLIVMKNNKYGLLKVKYMDDGTLQKEVVLNRIYDTIVLKNNKIFFLKNDLWGWYPNLRTPRYTYISEFNYYLARFILPSGKEGWVDEEGREFLDEYNNAPIWPAQSAGPKSASGL